MLRVGRDQTISIPVQVFLSEKRMAAIRKPLADNGSTASTGTDSRDTDKGGTHEMERRGKGRGSSPHRRILKCLFFRNYRPCG
jgi:hypothetical protein